MGKNVESFGHLRCNKLRNTIMWPERTTKLKVPRYISGSTRMLPFKFNLFLRASLCLLLISTYVKCDDEEEALLKDLNNYRYSQSLPSLAENDKAACLADDLADELEDQPCDHVSDYLPVPDSEPKIPNFRKHVKKCGININTTSDAVILPVCVRKLDHPAVLDNYTHSPHYVKYINDSQYTGAGLGSEDDWMIVILTTNTSTGNVSAASYVPANVFQLWLALLLGMTVFS